MKVDLKYVAIAVLVGVLGTVAAVQANEPELQAVGRVFGMSSPADSCQMSDVVPDKGTLQLEFLRPSSDQDPDRNDYRLSGTMRWDNQADLDCFAAGAIDWAYEHSIEYGIPVKRVIWNENFNDLDATEPYLDTTVDSNESHTELTVGLAKPERLEAGRTYSFSYDLLLAKDPKDGKQWITQWGNVVEKQCSFNGPWCSGLNTKTKGKQFNSDAWIGWTRGFAVKGTSCWAWRSDGSAPTDCSPRPEPRDEGGGNGGEASSPPPVTTPAPATAQGIVTGCNTYGQNCEVNPLYVNVPAVGFNWKSEPKLTAVSNGAKLTARCYAIGGMTYNWAVSIGDRGPDPYESNVYYSVQAPDGRWGFIPDTYFVRDQGNRMGLPAC